MQAKIVLGLTVFLIGVGPCVWAPAAEYVYRGTWQTVNRPLDGEMTCVVKPIAEHQWQGRFFGVWQGVDFDYTVRFTGPPKDLKGSALIDGASYEWRAWITRDAMKSNFTGSRYEGSFELKRVPAADVAREPSRPSSSGSSR